MITSLNNPNADSPAADSPGASASRTTRTPRTPRTSRSRPARREAATAERPSNIDKADPFTVAANEILMVLYRLHNDFRRLPIDDVTAKLEEAVELLNTLSLETRESWLVEGKVD